MEREIAIRGEVIRLGQLLKLAGLIDAGGEAAAYLEPRAVCASTARRRARRGCKIRARATRSWRAARR